MAMLRHELSEFGARVGRRFRPVRPGRASSAEEFVDRNGLAAVVSGARELARERFGNRLAGVALHLHTEGGASQFVEVEVGVVLHPDRFLAERDSYLDALDAAYPGANPDLLHFSVRVRAPTD